MIAARNRDLLAATLAGERAIMDEYAPEYRRWTVTGSLVYREERTAFARWLLDGLRREGRDPAGLRLLDVGCGTGELLEDLRGAGWRRLVGLDLSPAMLVETRRHVPEAELVRGALEEHPFAPASFDVLTAAYTVHHLLDPRAFFEMAGDVLAPGGAIFVLDFNRGSWSFSGWTRPAIRLLAAPLRFVLRRKNRREIAAQPALRSHFNPAHRLLDLAELAAAARASGFEGAVVTRGLLTPWFVHEVFETSRLDRALLRGLHRVDRAVAPARRGSYQWMAARRPVRR